jgi:probable HAF family extracellular repeat protein
MTDLGTLGGSSSALDINSKTQVVGFSFLLGRTMPPFRHAFLWENGTMLDLNHLIPSNSTPFELIAGENINDRGEIVALGVREGCFPDFCGHIFLLIPCGVEAAIESCDNGIHDTAAASQDKVARSMVNPRTAWIVKRGFRVALGFCAHSAATPPQVFSASTRLTAEVWYG